MRILFAILALIILGAGIIWFNRLRPQPSPVVSQQNPIQPENLKITTIAEGLDTPWSIAFLPDKSMLVTERAGRVRLIDPAGKLQKEPVVTLSSVKEIGEGGLMGMALHPDFNSNNSVYFYYTYNEANSNTLNRVVRMTYKNHQLTDEQIIVDKIPGAQFHNGGRIKFGPDKFLYITTGDAQNPSQSQDINSLAGKILRVTENGKPAPGNPFSNEVYSYGHRNPQGIAWDHIGRLWEVEHGQTAQDEFNLIESGKNYGWPVIRGDQAKSGMQQPRSHSGDETWAPAGAAFYQYGTDEYSIFYGGLRGQTLYEMYFKSGTQSLKEHFKNELGRIREVVLGPDNMLYITTSNKDGRGDPKTADDRILRINPE